VIATDGHAAASTCAEYAHEHRSQHHISVPGLASQERDALDFLIAGVAGFVGLFYWPGGCAVLRWQAEAASHARAEFWRT